MDSPKRRADCSGAEIHPWKARHFRRSRDIFHRINHMKFRTISPTPTAPALGRPRFSPSANPSQRFNANRWIGRWLAAGWLLTSVVTSLAQTIPFEWVRQIGGPGSEEVTKSGNLAIDAQGNCFISGTFHSGADFGGAILAGF